MAAISEEDEGKDVVASNGEKIGLVKEVRAGDAFVDPDPGLTDELMAKLGWGDSDADTYKIAQGDIESVTDDEVRLSHGT